MVLLTETALSWWDGIDECHRASQPSAKSDVDHWLDTLPSKFESLDNSVSQHLAATERPRRIARGDKAGQVPRTSDTKQKTKRGRDHQVAC